jgi:DNA-binding PadR family transcriptional regulator
MSDTELAPIQVAALGFLTERPMHPYEMYQLAILRREDAVVKISPGSLYRAVYALESRGLVESTGTDRDGARPERTTFAITESGRDALTIAVTEMLSTPSRDYPRFALALSEASVLSAELVIAILGDRLEALREIAELYDSKSAIVAAKQIPQMYLLNVSYSQAITRAEIAWIEQTVDALRSGALSWRDDRTPEQKAVTSGLHALSNHHQS